MIGQPQRVGAVEELGEEGRVSYIGAALKVHVHRRLPVSR